MNNEEIQEFAPKPAQGEPWDVVIIGSGPAGLTAAIYTTRGAASTLILAGDAWGGQLQLTTTVDNYPAMPGVQGPELMQKMREHALMFGAEIVDRNVTGVNFSARGRSSSGRKSPFEIAVDDKKYFAKAVIIATGADTRWLGVPGEEKLRGRGVSSCAPCDAPFFKRKNVVVVGGGDSAMEEALVLTKYAQSVTIIHRRDEFKASAAMQDKVMHMHGEGKIKIIWSTEVSEIIGDSKVEKVRLKTKLDSEEGEKHQGENQKKDGYVYWEMPIEGVFVAIGHVPSTNIFKGKLDLDEKGYVKKIPKLQDSKTPNGYQMATSVPGVFVAGDVHDYHYRQAITAAGFGCQAAMDALTYLDKATPSW